MQFVFSADGACWRVETCRDRARDTCWGAIRHHRRPATVHNQLVESLTCLWTPWLAVAKVTRMRRGAFLSRASKVPTHHRRVNSSALTIAPAAPRPGVNLSSACVQQARCMRFISNGTIIFDLLPRTFVTHLHAMYITLIIVVFTHTHPIDAYAAQLRVLPSA